MGYLFGDATPFPFDDNFIETLRSLIDACVNLFRVHSVSLGREHRVRDARQLADSELKRIDELSNALGAVLKPYVGSTPATSLAASRIAENAKTALIEATQKISATRDDAIRAAMASNKAEEVRNAVSPFFLHHQLPNTSWSAQWKVPVQTDRAIGSVIGTTAGGLQLLFDVAIPNSSVWSHALKVSDFVPELRLTIHREPGLLGKAPRVSKESVHKLLITEVHSSPEQRWMVVRPTAKRPCKGLRLVAQDGPNDVPVVVRVDENGAVEGREQMVGENAANIKLLWEHVSKRMDHLVEKRQALKSIVVGEDSGKMCENPAKLAEVILSTIAPIVLEIRKRSRVPGELVLKRELSDGRREELFVPRNELCAKFSALPDSQRRIFEAMGLSIESTQEFTTRVQLEPGIGHDEPTKDFSPFASESGPTIDS